MTELEFIRRFNKSDIERAIEGVLSNEDLSFICRELMDNERLNLERRLDGYEKMLNESDEYDTSIKYFQQQIRKIEKALDKLKESYESLEAQP